MSYISEQVRELREISEMYEDMDGGEILKEAADTIESFYKKQSSNGWIPCSERLPECDGEYICTQEVYSLSNGRLINRTVESVEFCDGEWRRAKHLKVIAWMSLPEPYTENPNG